ncbi:MAG: ABC transporter ATP-binding protein [Pseudomonadota bacterium]|jgi:putative ABC transport system ATP-binding protein
MATTSSEIAIRCRALKKSYYSKSTETVALRGVDVEIPTGELFMLVGPSGCGKTTLISVIAGILNYDSGECSIYGTNLQAMSDSDRTQYRGRNIGFVFQSYNLIPSLTTCENVSIPLLLQGIERPLALKRSQEVLTRVGLSDKHQALPTELSGGQQQRVAIARALVHNPKLIVCDEPTSALDHATGAEIMELFRQEALSGQRTLVIVTHDSRIFHYADRIGVMDDGLVTKVVSSSTEL